MMRGCGCEDRKHIMFEQGHFGWPLVAVLLAVPLGVYLIGRMSK